MSDLASRFGVFGIPLPRPFITITPRRFGRFARQVIEKLELLQANVDRQIAETEKSAAMNLRLVQELTEASQELVENKLTADAARRQMKRDRNSRQ